MRRLNIALLLGVLLLMQVNIAVAQTCQQSSILATTPSSQFKEHGDGTVTDSSTGLMWKKCSEGQVWEAVTNTCTGGAAGYKWQAALQQAQAVNNTGGFAGKQDWRVPDIKALNSITERQCIEPAINLTVFPNTSSAWFWSSSSNASDSQTAHYINLIIGNGNWDLKTNGHQLRLVRGGQ